MVRLAAALPVPRVQDEIAKAHDVAVATVAVPWLLSKRNAVAPIASARVAGQLNALLAATTFSLSTDEATRLDTESGHIHAYLRPIGFPLPCGLTEMVPTAKLDSDNRVWARAQSCLTTPKPEKRHSVLETVP